MHLIKLRNMNNSVIIKGMKNKSILSFNGIAFILFACFIVFCNVQLLAQGNLLIAPHRVVLDTKNRVIDVTLANTGQDSAKYSISFIQYRISEEGNYEEIKTPDQGQNFADQNVRFFPRAVLLGPGEAQVVKLQLIKSEQLATGEYRSHLYFRAIPNQQALGEEGPKKDSAGISIKIVPIFGITIPVLVRIGESTTTLNLSDLKLETTNDGVKKLSLSIHRSGNMSSLGDIKVTYIDVNGKETKVGFLEGVSVYTPNLIKKLQIDIEKNSSVDLSKGKLHILYFSQNDTRTVKLAETDLVL